MYTLITAATSSQAYKLKNTLDSDHIFLGDYIELPELLIKSGKALLLPDPQKSSYTHEMLALCLDKDIDTIYALRENELESLMSAKQLFAEYNIEIKAIDNEI